MRYPALFIPASMVLIGSVALGGEADDRFESKVRPVLAEHCLKCHGETKQASGLRLDSREAMLKGGSGEGPAIVPGDPEASPLIRAVRQVDDLKMPPKGHVPGPAVAELTAWVKAGAHWPATAKPADKPAETHWSFRPVRKATPAASGTTPVDAFINVGLASTGVVPSARADRRTLIRRASFDLLGLPPSAEDVDAFVADPRPDRAAFAALVDDLLASPHYGERWGRLWLDVARYADTKGYVFQEDRNYPFSYTYRDWVVAAFNDDLPYDQFVIQQVAADRLPTGTDNDHLAAMGFLTVGRRFLQDQNEITDDRIDVVTRGFLGLSVSCARCHDHKFDPIPTDDYYSLHGVFSSSEEPKELPLLGASSGAKGADYAKTMAERRGAVDAFLAERRSSVETELRGRFSAYLVGAEAIDFDPRSARLDEIAKAGNLKPEAVRRLALRWKGRADAGDPRLAPWKAFAAIRPDDFKTKGAEAVAAVKAMKAPAPLIHALTATPPGARSEVARRYGDLLARAVADPPDPALADLRAWVDSADGPIKVPEADLRRSISREDRNKLRELEKKVAQLDNTHPGAPARAMVMVDKPKPVEPRVFLRGNPGRPGPVVPRRFLKVLSTSDRPAFKDGSGRLELARAIVRPDNPLTARVMANRVWQGHFGRGIVGTPSDFGTRGDRPTHPELLDWLAATFVEGGWSVKSLHRIVMTSDAYARRSDAPASSLKADPENVRLGRQNRRRLDFESTRDALLSAAGRLDPAIGGKPTPLEAEPFPTRRALYGTIDRYNLEPVYRTFDFPNPDTSSPRRVGTIVPQQALYLLNSPFVAAQARALVASRPEVAPGSPGERIAGLYRRLFGRSPSPREVEVGLRFVTRPAPADGGLPGSPWHYGVGGVVEEPGKPASVRFRPLPHWGDKVWQVGPKLPADGGDFTSLRPEGSHPGPDPSRSTVLRWVAPADLTVAISGAIAHPAKAGQGDGVRARVVSGNRGVIGTWVAQAGKAETVVDRLEVRKGEAVDFVVDCRADPSFDTYTWAPSIRVVAPAKDGPRRTVWEAKADFHGPEAGGLNPWESYAQALLLSNEFTYID